MSHDRGVSFTSHKGPCVAGLAGSLAATTGAVWADCATGMLAVAWRSLDGGATFSVDQSPEMPNSAVLAVGDAHTAVLGFPDGRLFQTSDAARWSVTYTASQPFAIWRFVGFTTSQIVDVIAETGPDATRLLRSENGGRSWHEVAIR
ncbi:MAG: WD40/YVTN/BNR-like repeat-containing protein [Acidimicrobiales bacterium]